MNCAQQQTCSFFAEFQGDTERKQYQLFVKSYCFGTLQDTCKRLAYERQHRQPAPDNLCPNGFRFRTLQNR